MFVYSLGDDVELRILRPHHAAEFLAFVERERQHLGQWLSWAHSITKPEEAERFLSRSVERFAADGLPWVGIWLHDVMVGGVLFFPVDKTIRSTDVGYWLAKGATGRGLVTRSVSAMLDYTFGELNLNRVGLQAEVGNVASEAVAQRLGFVREGVRRATWMNQGRFVDMVNYSLLAAEWKARRAAAPH